MSPTTQQRTPPPQSQNGKDAKAVHFADSDRRVAEWVQQSELTEPEKDSIPQAISQKPEGEEHGLPEHAKPRNEDPGPSPEAQRSAVEEAQSPFRFSYSMADVPRSLDDLQLPPVSMKELEYCELAYRKLGSGVEVEVYRGMFRGLQRQLAVTKYDTVTAEDEGVFQEAANQSRILVHLLDTKLAPTFLGVMQDHPDGAHSTCLVQEVETEMSTLKRYLNVKGLADDTWMNIALLIARAVEVLHLKSVLHNNVNPDNIKVQLLDADHDMKVQLSEFGRSTYNTGYRYEEDADDLSRFRHLASEVKAGHVTSSSSDVYSLGAILSDIRQVADIPGLDNVASICMRQKPETRPTATTVVEMLQTVKEQMMLEDT